MKNTLYICACIGSLLYAQSAHALSPVACTMEARMCPDGSYVGRTGPNCEFTPCPNIQNPAASCPNISTTLRVGQRNTSVSELQKFIFETYRVQTKPTGYFGSITKQYVMLFQQRYGLQADGIIGPVTRTQITRSCSADGTSSNIPATCKVWFDGCNTCSRTTVGGPLMCTQMACIWANEKAAECRQSF